MAFAGEAQKTRYFNQKTLIFHKKYTKNQRNPNDVTSPLAIHKNDKFVNKDIKGVKSLNKYKHGFAIRTWKKNLLSKTDDFIKK